MNRVRRFLRLPGRRRRLLVVALVASLLVRVGLHVGSFRTTASVVDSVPGSTTDRTLADVRWATVAAGRELPGGSCLTRGVVAHALCRRYGYQSDLYVGVDRESESFTAHSWVESDGDVVVGDEVDLDRFEPLGVLG